MFFVLLPALGFIISCLFIFCLLQEKNLWHGWDQALLLASVGWYTWLVLSTEALSFFEMLNVYGLVISWLVYIILLLGIIYYLRDQLYKLHLPHLPPLSLFLKLTLICIGLIVLVTGLMALISPPNNIDSMVYHMSRVTHWEQNQSVAYYPACTARQNHQSPGAEFVIAHLQILSGGDYFANLVQWLSMLGCIVGGSFVARLLGADTVGQILTAVVVATIPMGVLQAVTTQNDYVVAFLLLCFVGFTLEIKQQENWVSLLGAAGSLALALLVKATAYLFAFPFVIWLGWGLVKTKRWQVWRSILIISIIALVINSGYFYRNFQLHGSPFGPGKEGVGFEYANQTFTLTTTISNIIRNLVLHIHIPSPIIQERLQHEVRQFHGWLGVSPDDPRITWGGLSFEVPPFRVHEDITGNFIHFLLIILSSTLILAEWLRHRTGILPVYVCLLFGAFGLFAFYLKWQPWNSRLHLSLFVLGAPVVGIVLSRLRPLIIQRVLIVILIIQVWAFILFNPLHPLINSRNIFNMSRLEQYFLSTPTSLNPYLQVAQVIHDHQCYQVGLSTPLEIREYLIWVALQANSDHPTQLHCLDVANESARLYSNKPPLCAVVCLDCDSQLQEFYRVNIGPPILSDNNNNSLFIQPSFSTTK